MERVYSSFPDDPEAVSFYALALLATAPSDSSPRAHADQAAQILLGVYEKNPDHPGAMHYLVHANDVPGRERESLEITEKYETAAPSNPHALHMPTHIYTRLGDWNGVIRGNLRAADAALKYPAGDRGEFVWDEFPHALEYLVYAYLQKGADDGAATQLNRLGATARWNPPSRPLFTWRRRRPVTPWSVVPGTRLCCWFPGSLQASTGIVSPGRKAIVRFARGLGAAHLGRVNGARAEVERLNQLDEATRKMGEDLFARNIRSAPARIELLACPRGATRGLERCADAGGRRA
jgi:hypothetical protein